MVGGTLTQREFQGLVCFSRFLSGMHSLTTFIYFGDAAIEIKKGSSLWPSAQFKLACLRRKPYQTAKGPPDKKWTTAFGTKA
jgi:hypothetical protein